MPSYANLPHMAVLDPDTSYKGAPRPRMGISTSTTYSNKLLSPGHERVRQGISTSSHLALFEKTENTRQNRTREVAPARVGAARREPSRPRTCSSADRRRVIVP